MNNKKTTFENFHISTWARFTPCPTPGREPDYISPSRSCYWDEGSGVIRSSDHWAGHNGCSEIASCIWSLDGDELEPGIFGTGFCRYDSFDDCALREVICSVNDRDIIAAGALSRAGGMMAEEEWEPVFGSWQPAWAFRYRRNSLITPNDVRQKLSTFSESTYVVVAQHGRLQLILSDILVA